jgi:hypothetical protein
MDLDQQIGKTVLVGLTWIAPDESQSHQQFGGSITGFVTEGRETPLVQVECDDGETRSYPWNESAVTVAAPGKYTLATTQKVFVDPDYLMQFSIFQNTQE